MDSLDQKLAEARERLREEMKANNPGIESFSRLVLWGEGYDDCATIAREVVAEKDKRIQELEVLVISSQPTCLCPECNCATKLDDICDYCSYNHILYGTAPRMDKAL